MFTARRLFVRRLSSRVCLQLVDRLGVGYLVVCLQRGDYLDVSALVVCLELGYCLAYSI